MNFPKHFSIVLLFASPPIPKLFPLDGDDVEVEEEDTTMLLRIEPRKFLIGAVAEEDVVVAVASQSR